MLHLRTYIYELQKKLIKDMLMTKQQSWILALLPTHKYTQVLQIICANTLYVGMIYEGL